MIHSHWPSPFRDRYRLHEILLSVSLGQCEHFYSFIQAIYFLVSVSDSVSERVNTPAAREPPVINYSSVIFDNTMKNNKFIPSNR